MPTQCQQEHRVFVQLTQLGATVAARVFILCSNGLLVLILRMFF